eukprot:365830-Chlamydomonas_euryale.AAC.6
MRPIGPTCPLRGLPTGPTVLLNAPFAAGGSDGCGACGARRSMDWPAGRADETAQGLATVAVQPPYGGGAGAAGWCVWVAGCGV